MTGKLGSAAGRSLTPPRGAAIAGVIFSVLMIVGLGLVRYAVPVDPAKPGTWLTEPDRREAVRFALDLVPFAGIAFLWFIGVLRNRLGELEDQFFTTVLLASGLLFVATLFVSAAVIDALIESVATGNIDSETYYFGRRITDALINVFAMKMAAVFMFSTCTIGLRTAIFPRWVASWGSLSARHDRTPSSVTENLWIWCARDRARSAATRADSVA